MAEAVSIHAVVYAKNLQQLAKFYEAVLGLVLIEEAAGYAVLQSHGYELSVVAMPAEVAARLRIPSPPVPLEETPIKLSFLVPSIEERRHVIAGAGGFLEPPEAAWAWRGQLHLDGVDPEGNVFQLRQLQG